MVRVLCCVIIKVIGAKTKARGASIEYNIILNPALRNVIPEYHTARLSSNWTTNEGEKSMGALCALPS